MAIDVKKDWYYLASWAISPSTGPVAFFNTRINGKLLSYFACIYKEGNDEPWTAVFRIIRNDLNEQSTPDGEQRHFHEHTFKFRKDATNVEAAALGGQISGCIAMQLKKPILYHGLESFGNKAGRLLKQYAANRQGVCTCEACFTFPDGPDVPSPSSN